MWSYVGTPARVPIWIAGISICLLTAAGLAAIARSIPASYASISVDGKASSREAASNATDDAHIRDLDTEPAIVPAVKKRRNGVPCPECGLVESIRKVERVGDISRQDTVPVKAGESVSKGASDAAIAPDAATSSIYEITVRFRDGSRTVLNDAAPRNWRLGSRVIVIGRLYAPND